MMYGTVTIKKEEEEEEADVGTLCDRYEVCGEEKNLCSYRELYPSSLVVHPTALLQ
jgi:ferritin